MNPLTALDPETKSPDIVAENIDHLKMLFPDAFAEGKLDFEILKQLLGGAFEDKEEKYGLNWYGKRRARQLALTPSTGTLRPCPEESVDWDSTRNLMIEGDNLEVLKLLQKSYAAKVKLIYIDPPYNTGKDFIYPDDYKDNIKNYLQLTGQLDGNGHKIASNTESSGRFHTDWLNMIYPRLRLARALLKDDGLILISIDDNEVDNLRRCCSELFGEENFCAQFVWNTEGNTDNQYQVKVNHEYVLAYYKNAEFCEKAIGHVIDPNTPKESNLWKGVADNNINKNNPANPPSIVTLPVGFPSSEERLFYGKKNLDQEFFDRTQSDGYISDHIKEVYALESKSGLPVKLDDMVIEDFRLAAPCRIYVGMANKNKLLEFIRNGCQPIDDDGTPLKFYINVNAGVRYHRQNDKPRNILSVLRNLGTTEKTRTYLKSLGIYYDYPKPVALIEYLIRVGCESDDIVMDFFAGSGTTAEAVGKLNISEGAKRRFICIQLPETFSGGRMTSAGGKVDTLADIAKQRVKAVFADVREGKLASPGDVGFRVFKLASSNIHAWEPDQKDFPKTLQESVEHLKADRTEQDILFELLLKLGLDLTVPIEHKTIAGKLIHSIGSGSLLACMAEKIDDSNVELLALGIVTWHESLAPTGQTTIVFRDSAFADDVAKTNLTAILQQHGLDNVRSL